MNRETLRRLSGSLFFRILVLLLLFYVLYHLVTALSDRILTDVVTEGEESVLYSGTGTVFRAETPLYLSGNGALLSYSFDSGEKVNAASVLFEAVYLPTAGEAYAELGDRLTVLDTRIRSLNALIRKSQGDTLADLETLTADAEDQLTATLTAATGGATLARVSAEAESLLNSLNRVSALTDKSASLSVLLAKLQAQRLTILQSVGGVAYGVSLGTLYTASSGGYFYHADAVDGYENRFPVGLAETVTLSDYALLQNVLPETTPTGRILCGKLVTSYIWYFALPLPASVAGALSVGKSYTLTFPEAENTAFVMTLERLTEGEGDRLAVFSCDTTEGATPLARFSTVSLSVSTVRGLRIPTTALHDVDGVTGVYILNGGRVCFRRVEILLRGDGYVLVYQPTAAEREENEGYSKAAYVAVRDILITRIPEGENLYDGKYIN